MNACLDDFADPEACCMHCNYMLRGLGQKHNCPECGRPFDLADPETHISPGIHHWTDPAELLRCPTCGERDELRYELTVGNFLKALFGFREGDFMRIRLLHRCGKCHARFIPLAMAGLRGARCWVCGYALGGMEGPQCPKCGKRYAPDFFEKARCGLNRK